MAKYKKSDELIRIGNKVVDDMSDQCDTAGELMALLGIVSGIATMRIQSSFNESLEKKAANPF